MLANLFQRLFKRWLLSCLKEGKAEIQSADIFITQENCITWGIHHKCSLQTGKSHLWWVDILSGLLVLLEGCRIKVFRKYNEFNGYFLELISLKCAYLTSEGPYLSFWFSSSWLSSFSGVEKFQPATKRPVKLGATWRIGPREARLDRAGLWRCPNSHPLLSTLWCHQSVWCCPAGWTWTSIPFSWHS